MPPLQGFSTIPQQLNLLNPPFEKFAVSAISLLKRLSRYMSANYWHSAQCRFWNFAKEQLATRRQQLDEDNAELVRKFPLPQ
ncbi:hypothetical protein BFJ63_vAg17528 [Fusarium oxysporum f. sp. narcissi]|uniref:Uncharacterized protein n=1 Tax=Fusarium oxysporum f. sp. narcissi TaxID=451672 RepID=A0A4Q2V0L2_FUSOX|nr:hypothetical protein BFJ63_vAg17528 [Fusarium oxysporum f. sp. narcissi]